MEKVNKTIINMMEYVSREYYDHVFDPHATYQPPYHYMSEIKGEEANELSTKVFDLNDMYNICKSHQFNNNGNYRNLVQENRETGISETAYTASFRDKLLKYFVINEALNQDEDIEKISDKILMKLLSDDKVIFLATFYEIERISYGGRWNPPRTEYEYGKEMENLEGIDKLTKLCRDYVKLSLFEYLLEKLFDIYNNDFIYASIILETYLYGKTDNDIFKGNVNCFPKDPTISKIIKLISHEEMLRIIRITTGGNLSTCIRNSHQAYKANAYTLEKKENHYKTK